MATTTLLLFLTIPLLAVLVSGQTVSSIPSPGQPSRVGPLGQFEIIGDSLVSAQQGGNVMGNGTWVNVGGNQAVTYGGAAAVSQNGGGPYDDPDGRQSETLEDGTLIILGGCRNGGYVNSANQDNPTYEFFPPKGAPITLPILQRTLPANLFPLTWLLPSGRLFIQSNWETVLYDYKKQKETPLDDIPDAVRVYPASAGTVMLPLTPANNWTATILFCGGSNVKTNQWLDPDWIIPKHPASTSCVRITPDISQSYVHDDPLPEQRSMGNLIFLPDGKILCLNGAKMGTAGYGNQSWAIGMSYADSPVLVPAIYDPAASAGRRWSRDGLGISKIPRMYHSSAVLLPDGECLVVYAFISSDVDRHAGSVFVSGSNPNSDYNVGPDIKYPTEYRSERFYPSYYNSRRPQPVGIPSQLNYGGPSFNISLDSNDLFGDVNNVRNATVVVIRPGFSTHSMNMGQRFVQLENTFIGSASSNTAVLHVSQLPPNPAILAPGPALVFVVVNGVPSVGVQVMVGSGNLGKQDISPIGDLPQSNVAPADVAHAKTDNAASRVGQRPQLVFGVIGLLGWVVGM
ncbi:hypothetical protein C0992_003612 [Termitomyces sp. T32_za158]|nr:hypothetical protein C0992_003612 [Termitomyces sp. T32_za158]